MKKLWNIIHELEVDGGFGDAIYTEDLLLTVSATQEEIEEFIEKFNKPRVYDTPYDDLHDHSIRAEEIFVHDISDIMNIADTKELIRMPIPERNVIGGSDYGDF